MHRTCWRTFCTNEVTGNGHKALTNFFGNESWKNATNEENLIEIYKMNILKERNDAVILSTQIKSSSNFSYTLIFITHKTEGDNPWMKSIREVKEEIEKHSDLAVKMSLDIIKNRQATLDF